MRSLKSPALRDRSFLAQLGIGVPELGAALGPRWAAFFGILGFGAVGCGGALGVWDLPGA